MPVKSPLAKAIEDIPSDVQKAKQRFSIVGNSPLLIAAVKRALAVAPIDLSVLVTGESGSGKEFFPKIIHYFGTRKHKKYIAVNCGAIPEGTIDSELFGHEKGSFTGAVSSRKGYFEEADGGTIFLDEVAELPLTTQARLLRVLETGEYLRVGSSEVQRTDIRVVAATNVDLLKAVAAGKFREDLYYRLSTIIIPVPNLHDRGSDIYLLARKFTSDFAEKYITRPVTFSEDARRLMELYRWPGNVRQLKNVVEQLSIFHAGEEISRETLSEVLPLSHDSLSTPVPVDQHSYAKEREMLLQTIIQMQNEIRGLRADIDRLQKKHQPLDTATAADEGVVSLRSVIPYEPDVPADIFDMSAAAAAPTLEDSEKEAITAALARNGGNKQKTARELNISIRTLYRKIRELNINA